MRTLFLSVPRALQPRTQIRRVRRGVAASEFAIISPLFFMLAIGFIELGRGMMVQQILTNASRVGARLAATPNSTESEVVAAVEDYAHELGSGDVSVSVDPDPATAGAGDEISVTASVIYEEISWLPAPWFLGGQTLTASSVMRKEGFE